MLRQGGGLQLARPLCMGDNRKRIVTPSIASTARLRANHHVSQRVLLTWPSRYAISADVTRTRDRQRRPQGSFRKHLPRRAARRPLNTSSHEATCFPNSHHSLRRHFNRPLDGLVPTTGRFHAGFRIRSRARLGRPQNTKRTSYTMSRGADAVSKINPSVT